jgi:hypothetical protein
VCVCLYASAHPPLGVCRCIGAGVVVVPSCVQIKQADRQARRHLLHSAPRAGCLSLFLSLWVVSTAFYWAT